MKYKVTITRTSFDSHDYEVEADSIHLAEEMAYEMAYNDSWGSGNAEYEIESIENED